ncbi:MAG: alpha-2-macroglobulin family protein [Pseudomonadota bacterium]
MGKRRNRTGALAVAFAGGLTAVLLASIPAAAERVSQRLDGIDLPGADYATLRDTTLSACERQCIADTKCGAFTFNSRVNWCFLKSSAGAPSPYPFAISGIVTEVVATQPLPLPDLTVPPSAERAADQVAAAVDAVRASARPVGVFLTADDRASLPGEASAGWLSLAKRALNRSGDNDGLAAQNRFTALGAAMVALRRATSISEQAAALATLSAVVEADGLARPAIGLSAASVELDPEPAETERLASLRARYGFRVLDYSVDSASATPRLCVQFSEELAGDTTALERFVVLADTSPSNDANITPAITLADKELCVSGLSHGERYQLVLRAGLPAVTGERLSRPAEFITYVRDRPATARFDTNRFVLPASAPGVPVSTINSAAVDVALYRIGDRNLATAVRDGTFKRQLRPYELQEIADDTGALIAERTMTVTGERNQEARTLVPVRTLLGTPEPGVYVLTARPVEATDEWAALATQWFVVSDIGLATFAAQNGTVDVFARTLGTLQPMANVTVVLLARNDEVLAAAKTDGDGYANLRAPGRGTGSRAPALVTAQHGTDYAFVDLTRAAFELSDRGVEGRAAPGPVDAFLTTERAVYRAGETVHLTALMRDDTAAALNVPVTLKLLRPDGKLSRTLNENAATAGGIAVALPLANNAATGTWRVQAHLDPKGPPVGETTFLVEDFVPQRIEVSVTAPDTAESGDTITVDVAADFLYGAPAAGLILDGTLRLTPAATVPGYPGYRFGIDGERPTPSTEVLAALPRTDAAGRAGFATTIPEIAGETGPLNAAIAVSVREPGGRAVTQTATVAVRPAGRVLGVRPLFSDLRVAEGGEARFDIIALDADLIQRPGAAKWRLIRLNPTFQWYRVGDRWNYERIDRTEEVASGSLTLTAEVPATIAVPTDWGRYRLEVSDPTDQAGTSAAAVAFSAGYGAAAPGPDTPDMVAVTLDRESYRSGDTATLRIDSERAGKALVAVLGTRLIEYQLIDVPAGGANLALPVRAGLAPGAYVAVTMHYPANEADDRPLPQRAVGIAHMAVDTAPRRLALTIAGPAEVRPDRTVDIPIAIENIDGTTTAYLTLAAVDVGVLNVTGMEPPDPAKHYLGQRRLGVELRDLWGDLIDASGAAMGRLRSGGDGAAGSLAALPPAQAPVSLFSGLVETDASGNATVTLALPPFDGTLRLMAIAWTDRAVGNAHRDLLVREPVVMVGAMPRFLAPSDITRLRFDIHNIAHPAGDYSLDLTADGPFQADAGRRTFTLAEGQRTGIEIPLTAISAGAGEISATLYGPDGLAIERRYALTVRPASAPVERRQLIGLAPGEVRTIGQAITGNFAPGASAILSVDPAGINAAGLLAHLDRFPYGCAEQTVSRALPLLYVNRLAERLDLTADQALPERIDNAIRRVLGYQSTSGGFGLWGPGGDLWLTAYVMDFLTRARETGHAVEPQAFASGLDRLQSMLSYVDDVSGARGRQIAYATYVLARNGRAAIGDVRYLAQEKAVDFNGGLAKAQLAASLAFAGDRSAAVTLFRDAGASLSEAILTRQDYGSNLRDAAAMLTLAAEAGMDRTVMDRLTDHLETQLIAADEREISTQEAAWLVMASNAQMAASNAAVAAGAQTVTGDTPAILTGQDLAAGLTLRNDGPSPVLTALTVAGTPLTPLPPATNGLTIGRRYLDASGTPVDPSRVTQNERFTVQLTLTKTRPVAMRLMLTDLLPAGFEIENPRLMPEGSLPAGIRAQSGPFPDHVEFRDDRFAASWSLGARSTDQRITVSYSVRAVTPGRYVHPGAHVVDMYRPENLARTATGTVSVLPAR